MEAPHGSDRHHFCEGLNLWACLGTTTLLTHLLWCVGRLLDTQSVPVLATWDYLRVPSLALELVGLGLFGVCAVDFF